MMCAACEYPVRFEKKHVEGLMNVWHWDCYQHKCKILGLNWATVLREIGGTFKFRPGEHGRLIR